MAEINQILPDWYLDFLDKYDLLKNESGKFYFLPELEQFHHKLGQCTLLRLDDKEGNEYISMEKRTISIRDYLNEHEPDFPGIGHSVVIGRSGFCNRVDEWSTSVLLMVKHEGRNELYFIDTDSAVKAKLITAEFKTFFPDLPDALEKAREKLAKGEMVYTRGEDGQLSPSGFSYLGLEVRIEPVKPLSAFLDESRYIHFDTEGFESIDDYMDFTNRLLGMTGLEYMVSVPEQSKNSIQIKIQAEVQEITFGFDTDYFDDEWIEVLNALVSKLGISSRFQEIYPFTVHHADQTMAIGFCTQEEIEVLIGCGYIES